METSRVERRSVVCVDCRNPLPLSPKWPADLPAPDPYTCDTCLLEKGQGRRITEESFTYVKEWSPLRGVTCSGCGGPYWSVGFVTKAQYELTDPVDGERTLYPPETRMDFTECPNPACVFAWGSGDHHMVMNEIYPFFVPPWAQAPDDVTGPTSLTLLGHGKLIALQVAWNARWWDERKSRRTR